VVDKTSEYFTNICGAAMRLELPDDDQYVERGQNSLIRNRFTARRFWASSLPGIPPSLVWPLHTNWPNQDAQLTEEEGYHMKPDRMKLGARLALAVATVGVGLIATATPAQADTFPLTSCHVTGSACLDGNVSDANAFGTVTLTQIGSGVLFDVVLNNGNGFVETGAGGFYLFLINDAPAGSTITNITATLNGALFTVPGGLTGDANISPAVHADGTGDLTAGVRCTVFADCNGGTATQFFNDLHFTVTNATLAQLETANTNGNIFVADIICGATQPGCTGGLTGPVDANHGVVPDGGMTVTLLGFALVGLESLRRRFRA
jgi:hypothetical protein